MGITIFQQLALGFLLLSIFFVASFQRGVTRLFVEVEPSCRHPYPRDHCPSAVFSALLTSA